MSPAGAVFEMNGAWCGASGESAVRSRTELGILSQHGKHVAVYLLRSKRAVREFLDT